MAVISIGRRCLLVMEFGGERNSTTALVITAKSSYQILESLRLQLVVSSEPSLYTLTRPWPCNST